MWAQTFSYDAFGNLTKTGSSQFQPGYNWQTNQMASGASYDANGDVLSDSLHSYAWDANGRPTTIDTVTVTYDALGRMTEQNKSGSYTEIVYDALGSKLALMSNTSTLKQGFAPLPGGATAVYNASGLQYYRHPDWLGSSRFASTPSRTMYNDLAFAPFGEPYAQAGGSDTSFTGQNQDTTTNLYDFMFREYGIQGRWPSPDPAGLAAANPANPQSWNRYAYVLNSPTELMDPLGFNPLEPCTNRGAYRDEGQEECVCDDTGCFWIPASAGSVQVNASDGPPEPPDTFWGDNTGEGWPSGIPIPSGSPQRGGGSGSPQKPTPPASQTPQPPKPTGLFTKICNALPFARVYGAAAGGGAASIYVGGGLTELGLSPEVGALAVWPPGLAVIGGGVAVVTVGIIACRATGH